MSEGQQTVGHPVDVASGSVFTKRRDFYLPGMFALDWVRNYSTDCDENSWLGRGWTVPLFMRLERRDEDFLLVDEIGRPIRFACTEESLRVGGSVVIFGANMELSLRETHYEILHWHPGSNDVERFCFLRSTGTMPLAWLEDVGGRRLSMQYDALGRPMRVTQELEERCVDFEFNSDDLLVGARLITEGIDPLTLVEYEYDAGRRLVRSRDAVGSECLYVYDDAHRLTVEKNPLGSAFGFRYDSSGRCVHTMGGGGYLERRLEFSESPKMTRVTDGLGNATRFFLNPAGQVIQEISALGAVTTSSYDGHGRLLSRSVVGGSSSHYVYDERGDRASLVDGIGSKFLFEHNSLHLMTKLIDAEGACWTYDYDAHGDLIGLTNPLGARSQCRRDERGRVIESRQPGGLVTRRRYAPAMRAFEVADQISLQARIDVDFRGSQIATYDAAGLVHSFRNDVLGRPVEMTDAAGRVMTMKYNANHDMVERTMPGGAVEVWTYDVFGRLLSHTNDAGVLQLSYDIEDHLVEVVNRAGDKLSRSYDADGRLVEQRLFDGRVERYAYDMAGRRTQELKADGSTIDYVFDAGSNMIVKTCSDGFVERFARDRNGRLLSAENNDSTLFFERDALGRVLAEIQNGQRVECSFDVDNNKVGRRVVGVGADVRLKYDMRGRLSEVEDERGGTQRFKWGDWNQLARSEVSGIGAEDFAYDSLRRVAFHTFTSAQGSRLLEQALTYDEKDNVARVEDANVGASQYSYDAINRLTSVQRERLPSEAYEYDPAGTIVRANGSVRSTGVGGRAIAAEGRSYEFDGNGCVCTIDSPAAKAKLRHRVDGRLAEVELPDARHIRFAYDALGRRISKSADGHAVKYLWQSCDLACELAEGERTQTYFHQNLVPVAHWDGDERLVPVTSPMGLPQIVVGSQGQVLWRAAYDAYGNVISESGSRPSPFRFRGQYADLETGLYYNFSRYYDPRLASYLEPDPIGLAGGSQFYAYPRNPLIWDDPFGLVCSNAHKGQMGEAEMDAHFANQGPPPGYQRMPNASGQHGSYGAQGIDGVYHNPNGSPPYIIGEAKYGSSRLGSTLSGRQMSDNWIDSPIGASNPSGTSPSRLEAAVGAPTAAQIQSAPPGSVERQVFNLPAPGTPGTGSVTQTAPYTPGSGGRTFP